MPNLPKPRLRRTARTRGGVATRPSEPERPNVEVVESSVEIIDVGSGGRVITTIEFVSRSNKRPGTGRKQYLSKRKETIRAGASVVLVGETLMRSNDPAATIRDLVA